MGTDFKIKFDGEKHEINADSLVSNLVHTTSVIQEINRYIDSGKRIDIKIKALEKGSFLIHIELIESALESLKTLLTKDNIETGGLIISALVGLIEIKRFLKGKDSKKEEEVKGDKVKIENENGNVIYIDSFVQNIYNSSPVVKEALSKSFQSLKNDESINGYEIIERGKTLVRVEREEFEHMAQNTDNGIETEGERVVPETANLNVLRISFDKKLKSDFYFRGNKISVKINDPEFYKKIDQGASFSKGDTLEVELLVKQVFESSVNTYVNKSYEVNKILKHIKREEQSEIKFDEQDID